MKELALITIIFLAVCWGVAAGILLMLRFAEKMTEREKKREAASGKIRRPEVIEIANNGKILYVEKYFKN